MEIFIFAIIITVIILAVSLPVLFHIKFKIKLTVLIPFLLIAAVIITPLYMIVESKYHNNIWVTGYDDGKYINSGFNYELRNKRISFNGAISEFSANIGKEQLFEDLSTKFVVFEKDDIHIQLVSNSAIYTVKYLGDNKYILYGEYILITPKQINGNESLISFPFPTDKIQNSKEIEPRISKKFKFSCDYKYLEKFYDIYEKGKYKDVVFKGNTIMYGGIKLVIKNNMVSIVY